MKEIVEIHERGELMYFTVRIVLNLATQARNIYHKQTLTPAKQTLGLSDNVEDLSDTELSDRQEFEQRELKMIEELDKIDEHFNTFYHRAIVGLVVEHGSMSETARQTGIPKCTISRTIKKVREHLNRKVK